MTEKKQLNPVLKLVLDIGPLVLFFAANSRFGIYVATGAFMAAILVALAVSYALTRHLAVMPLVTAVIVLVFGGLTLALHDELFIKLKPTLIYVLFGGTLLGGLAFDKPLLGMVFSPFFICGKKAGANSRGGRRAHGAHCRARSRQLQAGARRKCRDCVRAPDRPAATATC